MRLKLFFLAVWASLSAMAAWNPDLLGHGYEQRTVTHPDDYHGPVVSTIVRKLAPQPQQAPAILYIHGFNDYFFNPELGNEAVDNGYNFYAVDLRKYGRSLRKGQRMCECRSLNEYFADIDSALVEMQRLHPRQVVLMGHSTGGLIAAYYMAQTRNPAVDLLVLNSPFLDWNLGSLETLVPAIATWGRLSPDTEIHQGGSTAYAESLLKSAHGEWTFNTRWKRPHSPNVTAGWINAIHSAQRSLRDGKANIPIPVLLMYSQHSVSGSEWTEAHNQGDAVLDVADIRKYGRQLGPQVHCVQVNGGLHDLFLSRPGLRRPLYRSLFRRLNLHSKP
jgi:alpha-beta hydrolase superfamily lysophospholipase